MAKINKQLIEWMGKFGDEYTKRANPDNPNPDDVFKDYFGISKVDLNKQFIGTLNKDIKVLEVGTGTGYQLTLLKGMGFKNLYGIEVNRYAIYLANDKGVYIIPGEAGDIPFKNNFFDLVFTSGLLIHIAPVNIRGVLGEIYRCSKKYIWGFEYYDKEYTERIYRGKKNLLWRGDFPRMYLDFFPGLRSIKIKKIPYLTIPPYWEKDDYLDVMFLLEKQQKNMF